jgi:hypothetical protein
METLPIRAITLLYFTDGEPILFPDADMSAIFAEEKT